MRSDIILSLSFLGFSGTAFAGGASKVPAETIQTGPATRMPTATSPTVASRPVTTAPTNRSGAPEATQAATDTSDAERPMQPTAPSSDEVLKSGSSDPDPVSAGGGTRGQDTAAAPSTTTTTSGNTTRKVGGKNKLRTKKKKKKKKGFKIDEYNPLYGTLVYGPKPEFHDKYTNAGNKKKKTVVKKKHLPERQVNRKGSLAAGVRGGTLIHGYSDGSSFSDLGLGAMVRYRPTEAMGLQLDLTHHADELLGSTRAQTLVSGSAEVFVFPWNSVQPYALIGLTSNGRGGVPGLDPNLDSMTGAHVGAGVELGLGKKMAFDVEARYIGWLNQDAGELANPGAISANAGLVFHF